MHNQKHYKKRKSSWNKGLSFSEETKKKMSLSKIGIKKGPHTAETKRKYL